MAEIQITTKGLTIWGICALFFLYEFFLRTVLGSYQHPLMLDLQMSSLQFSILSSTIFMVVYGLMQVPVGMIVDNFGLKKSLVFGSICCTLASFGFSLAVSYQYALFFRLFMGLGASFGFVCLLISVHEWMPKKNLAIFIGLSQFIGTLGPILAAGPLESLSSSSNVHWRSIFFYLGVIGVIITVLIFFIVENNQDKAGKYIILSKPEKVLTSIKRVFSKSQAWYIGILSASLYFTIEYLSENEGRAFLILRDLSSESAAYIITSGWLGFALGCPLVGFISDYIERRKIIVVVCSFISVLATLTFLYVPHKFALQTAFFMLGISASGVTVTYALMAEQLKKQFLALGFGLNNALLTTVSAINAPIIGYLLDKHSVKSLPTIGEYTAVFSILTILSIIALVFSIFFLKETFCKSRADYTILNKSH